MSEPGGAPDGSDPVELAHWLLDRARAGDTDRLVGPLDAGVSVDLADGRGNTLLMLAAYHGHAATVQALLERGADAEARNDRDQTPLAGAVFKGYPDVVTTLVAAGASPRAGTPNAWDTATFFDRPELLEILRTAPGERAS